ncbi:MAG: flavodoxin family protein [Spirochaetaceae bacterium]|nr:flavodoxin family protein [Spirochaetaceae bacterium]
MVPTKILSLNASPRKRGNTDLLSQAVLKAAREQGAVTETLYLIDQKIGLCTQCEGCHAAEPNRCVLVDDFAEIVEKLKAADVIVIATPIWWSGVHASLKLLLDRCYSLLSGNWDKFQLQGKGLVVIACQTQADENLYVRPLVKEFEVYQDWLKLTVIDSLVASAEKKGEILENAELMARAERVGASLAGWKRA